MKWVTPCSPPKTQGTPPPQLTLTLFSTENCQFSTEKCQFSTEKCQFTGAELTLSADHEVDIIGHVHIAVGVCDGAREELLADGMDGVIVPVEVAVHSQTGERASGRERAKEGGRGTESRKCATYSSQTGPQTPGLSR